MSTSPPAASRCCPFPAQPQPPARPEMTIEAIEIKGIRSVAYHPALRDPGASYLKIMVRDLDKTLALLKGERCAGHHRRRRTGGA